LKESFLTNKTIYNTFKKFEPIGCRDEATKNILKSVNIDAINNDCITLLMDKRSKEDEKNAKKLILVDVDEFIPMPSNFKKKDIEYKSQMVDNGEALSNDEKLELSKEILNYYRKNAKLIITSRFHCAMPCIAM
jgi:polysaccharide pyruvyl transferase WcaK-like protein